MHGKELHDFLFKLYDYADQLADRIQPGEFGNSNYFITIVNIEKYFDTVGRGEIHAAAKESPELDEHASLSEAHRRIDLLRKRISELAKEYNFNDALDRASEKLSFEWRQTE